MRQYVTFNIGEYLFGIDILLVQEIDQAMRMTPVPLAPAFVKGLIDLRGQIVPIFDLGLLLGFAPAVVTATSHNIVLKNDHDLGAIRTKEHRADLRGSSETVGLLVDNVKDVLSIEDGVMEAPSANMGKGDREFVEGVVKLPQHVLVVLRLGALVRLPEAQGL